LKHDEYKKCELTYQRFMTMGMKIVATCKSNKMF